MTRDMNEVELLHFLLECPSLSGEEEPYASLLSLLLRDEGFEVEVDDISNIYAWDPQAPVRLLFSTHIDTVPPYFPPSQDGDRVYGRGACDTKGGFVSMIMAARRLRAAGHGGIGFLLVVGEETDHLGARRAAEHPRFQGVQPRIILCEPTCNRLVRAQKGMLRVRLEAKGQAAHSAYPERGHSAIDDLLEVLHRLRQCDWPVDAELGETTLNIGLISGGVAANVIAPQAEATLVFRLTGSVAATLKLLEERLGVLSFEILSANEPVRYEIPDDMDHCVVCFNTDASFLCSLGSIWLVGPGDIQVAHSAEEHIALSSLREGIDLYERLARRALEGA